MLGSVNLDKVVCLDATQHGCDVASFLYITKGAELQRSLVICGNHCSENIRSFENVRLKDPGGVIRGALCKSFELDFARRVSLKTEQ